MDKHGKNMCVFQLHVLKGLISVGKGKCMGKMASEDVFKEMRKVVFTRYSGTDRHCGQQWKRVIKPSDD